MKNSNLKKKALAFGAGVAIMLSSCGGGSGGGSGGGTDPENPPVGPTEKTMILGDDLTDVGEGILTPSAITTTTYNGTTCKNVIFNASALPADTKLMYDGNTGTLTRIRIQGTADKLNIEVDNAIVGADAVTGESNIDVSNSVAKGDFYDITATSAGAGVVANANGGNKNLNYNYSVETVVVPPTDRIVLANTFNTAATNDIEPTNIFDTVVSYGGNYSETFNTVFYNASQFEAGKKYVFNGQLDSNGKVKDRVNIQGNVTNVDIVVNNATIYAGNFYGNSKLTFDMPCWEQEEYNGIILKINPKAPLDQVPVLEADSVSSGTVLRGPLGAKKRIAGAAPVAL